MASLVDLITQLQGDAARVAAEEAKRPRSPHHQGVGKAGYGGLPWHHLADNGEKHHAPLLYEERTHPE